MSSATPEAIASLCQEQQRKLVKLFSSQQAELDALRSRLFVAEDRAAGYAETALKVQAMWQAVEKQLLRLTEENKQLKAEAEDYRRGGETPPSVGFSPTARSSGGVGEHADPRVQDLISSQNSTIQQLKLDLAKTKIDLGQATAA